MRNRQPCSNALILGLAAFWMLTCPLALAQEGLEPNYFPQEDFVQINPTLPNSKLNFNDDAQESCCAKDYTPSGKPITRSSTAAGAAATVNSAGATSRSSVARSEFEKSNPRYLENSTPTHLVSCERFADFPELAVSTMPASGFGRRNARDNNLPIESYSTNVTLRRGAEYFTNPVMRNTSNFHIETAGGDGQVQIKDVHSYSICMARGNNVAMVANTDNGSILTYNGSDHIYLAGNNTNMITRTGAGEDLIELYQARPGEENPNNWTAYNIYKTAVSGGSDTDTLVIKGTPFGTKWCHIGGYRIFGEYFYVVEFALPPTVTEGPRRQRINIGESVEFVVIKGKKYRLGDFLVHGAPVDTIASSVPIGDPLPHVAIRR
jgi:hypothetical protein